MDTPRESSEAKNKRQQRLQRRGVCATGPARSLHLSSRRDAPEPHPAAHPLGPHGRGVVRGMVAVRQGAGHVRRRQDHPHLDHAARPTKAASSSRSSTRSHTHQVCVQASVGWSQQHDTRATGQGRGTGQRKEDGSTQSARSLFSLLHWLLACLLLVCRVTVARFVA